MSVITENNKDHLLNYEGVEQLLVKINDRFARTDRYATPDTLGMIRAEINTEVNSEDISTGDNHPVQITTDGNAFVNIDIPTSLPANGGNADTVDGKHAADFMLKSDANAGNWCTPIYISGGKSYTISTIEDTFIRWKHPDQLNQGTNLQPLFSPIDLASSAIHSANRFAFGNPEGITIEYSTDGGATWVDYGVGNFEKKSLISGIGFGLNLGKNLSGAGVTANDKLRITLNANAMGVYTQAYALHINVSTAGSVYNGENSIRVDVEKAYRGSDTNFTTWLSDLRLQGWSGWNKLPLGGISFGGDETQTSNTGALRLTFSTSGATEAFPNARPQIIDLQLIGSTTWQTPSNMAKNGHIYRYDANQNVVFPADINTKGDTYTSRLFIKGINSDSVNTTGYITSDSSYNMYISQNGLVPFVVDCSNTSAPVIRAGYSYANTVSLGTSTVPFKNVYAGGFTKKDSSDSYVLLGGGGHKSISDFAVANHNHTINLTSTFIPNVTSSYNDGILTITVATTNVEYTGTTDVENTNANPESWFVNPEDMTALF